MFQLLGMLGVTAAGVAWSVVPTHRRASGLVGVMLALVPVAGAYLWTAYC